MAKKYVSLVTGSIGQNIDCMKRLILSLQNSVYKFWELIIVLQIIDKQTFIEKIGSEILSDERVVIITADKGLSKARNEGLKYASGDVIGFPDDDAWYSSNFLADVVSVLDDDSDNDIFLFGIFDPIRKKDSFKKWPKKKLKIHNYNFYKYHNSNMIFIRSRCLSFDLKFDELLGVGAKYGSSEDVDFISCMLNNKFSIIYYPYPMVYHPAISEEKISNTRGYNYGLGVGAFIAKSLRLKISFSSILSLLQPMACLGRLVVFFVIDRDISLYNYYRLKGMFVGFIQYGNEMR